MKIAVDISQIAYQGSGVARYTKELVKNLISIDKENDYLLFGFSLRKKKVLHDFFSSLPNTRNFYTKIFSNCYRLTKQKLIQKYFQFPKQ